MTSLTRHIEPIYGNGWSSAPDGKSRDVPAPFEFTSHEGSTLQGIVTTVDHEFMGAAINLSPRYDEPSATFNVAISRAGLPIAYGFVMA